MKSYSRQVFAERLRTLRYENKIGQNMLAEKLQLSNASISYWETAKQDPSAEAIFKLSVFFNVSADYLLGIVDEW